MRRQPQLAGKLKVTPSLGASSSTPGVIRAISTYKQEREGPMRDNSCIPNAEPIWVNHTQSNVLKVMGYPLSLIYEPLSTGYLEQTA